MPANICNCKSGLFECDEYNKSPVTAHLLHGLCRRNGKVVGAYHVKVQFPPTSKSHPLPYVLNQHLLRNLTPDCLD
jgi:hypothetical protein